MRGKEVMQLAKMHRQGCMDSSTLGPLMALLVQVSKTQFYQCLHLPFYGQLEPDPYKVINLICLASTQLLDFNPKIDLVEI